MPTTKLTQLVLESFAKRLGKRTVLPFDEYVDFALYEEQIGYYSTAKNRVGRSDQTDFFTSSSFGDLWGDLIVDACVEILDGENLHDYTFVEIAAEPEKFVLSGNDHPFGKTQVIRLGDPFQIPSPAVVYSNEWLDAQVFKRFRFDPQNKEWMEMGVRLENGLFLEAAMDSVSSQAHSFPTEYANPYELDWPSGSIEALESLCSKNWSGLFLTFDYGLDQETLLKERPQGTARSYFRHEMGTDLLSNLGEQDITCHLCWDELIGILEKTQFNPSALVSQESFFMHHASRKIQEILSQSSALPTSKTQALKELIHPLHMGNKFQALWGLRKE